jgi:hypothetical protein
MKKIFLTLAVFVMALCASAQKNQYFWYQGNLMMGNPIAQIDSVTFGEGEPADTLHIMLPRTIIKTVHDTVYITIHDTVCPNELPSIEASKTEYMWLEGNQEFLINWNNDNCNIDYSFDKVNWTTAVATSSGNMETFTVVPASTKIYLRGVNGSTNSFYGNNWWGPIGLTTNQIYSSNEENELFGAEIRCGGNMLSLVFGDSFVEHASDAVSSTLSRICFGWIITDASLLYVNPASYGNNSGWLSSTGNQWGLFERCRYLKKGPYIKYLKTATFRDCRYLTDIYYIGDGSEITNTPIGSGFSEAEGGSIWFDETTSSLVDKLTIHVKKGVTIPYKPANAVVVEDLE